MNSRKVVYLFFTSLIIGSLSGAIVGLVLDWSMYTAEGIMNFIFGLIWLLGISAAFSLISQMGFFAYLTIHRLGLGLFKAAKLWNKVQVVIIAFVIFDLIYLRYLSFAHEGETVLNYIWMPFFLLIYGIIIAYFKAKDTNQSAFIPALFFIVVVTTIEWVPALTVNDPKWLWIYFAPLLTANTWQLLILHRLTGNQSK
ncbi:KinB-signaling pathway activation protein [Alkalihalobacillus sp. BA299]|uniref:KinB-signaling pathway activation protein n=1 Tax=Alkalihalobacillus sp. BA299 TaxID=2815938 RepID=UPI001ADBF4B5|nr:KinB-signaling pathway activation protein [Alkalihalobacillus sp. BA299]